MPIRSYANTKAIDINVRWPQGKHVSKKRWKKSGFGCKNHHLRLLSSSVFAADAVSNVMTASWLSFIDALKSVSATVIIHTSLRRVWMSMVSWLIAENCSHCFWNLWCCCVDFWRRLSDSREMSQMAGSSSQPSLLYQSVYAVQEATCCT